MTDLSTMGKIYLAGAMATLVCYVMSFLLEDYYLSTFLLFNPPAGLIIVALIYVIAVPLIIATLNFFICGKVLNEKGDDTNFSWGIALLSFLLCYLMIEIGSILGLIYLILLLAVATPFMLGIMINFFGRLD